MKIPNINFSNLARFSILASILIVIVNKLQFKSNILEIIAIALAVVSVIFIILFTIQLKNGLFKSPFQIILETNVENTIDENGKPNGVPRRIVMDSQQVFLNIIFNLAITYHFDLVPVEVLHDSAPNIPPMELQKYYNYSRSISDELNNYFRSQKFANKADVINHSDEIKEYLSKTYPWMVADTLENTYNYFFLGIGNG